MLVKEARSENLKCSSHTHMNLTGAYIYTMYMLHRPSLRAAQQQFGGAYSRTVDLKIGLWYGWDQTNFKSTQIQPNWNINETSE